MEDQLPLATPAERQFVCPGHTRPINRAVHLSRLAAFDPACLACPDRHDTAGLSTLAIAARAEVERRASPGWQWIDEGLVTSERGQLDRETPRQFAFALADILWGGELQTTGRARPTVHLGCGNSHHARELMAAVCRALELAGCDACEVGATTAPCLATSIAQTAASGGVWIGNLSGRQHELGLIALGRAGTPWSMPGWLNELKSRMTAGVVRPCRSGGSLRRFDAAAGYLPLFRETFHGLRALEFVLHTASHSLVEFLDLLRRETALRVTRLDESRPLAAAAEPDPPEVEFAAAELAAVGSEVVLSGAHFGFWTDGAGQRCELVDERGRMVSHERLARLLRRAAEIGSGEPRTSPEALQKSLGELTRERLGELSLSAQFTGMVDDGRGCYWLAGQTAPDALAVLCTLLTLLSRSDRPLSEVLDADATAL